MFFCGDRIGTTVPLSPALRELAQVCTGCSMVLLSLFVLVPSLSKLSANAAEPNVTKLRAVVPAIPATRVETRILFIPFIA